MPGILSLDVHQEDTSKIVTAGSDRNCTVFNKDTEQVVCILKGHTKKVTKVIYHPEEVSAVWGGLEVVWKRTEVWLCIRFRG